jgi:hypothetical protein
MIQIALLGLIPIVGGRTKKICLPSSIFKATEHKSKIEDEEKDIVDQIEKEMKERDPQKTLLLCIYCNTKEKTMNTNIDLILGIINC